MMPSATHSNTPRSVAVHCTTSLFITAFFVTASLQLLVTLLILSNISHQILEDKNVRLREVRVKDHTVHIFNVRHG